MRPLQPAPAIFRRLAAASAVAAASAALLGCPGPRPDTAGGPPATSPTPAATAPTAAALPPPERVTPPPGTFYTLPYLQIGDAAASAAGGASAAGANYPAGDGASLTVVWHVPGGDAGGWTAQVRQGDPERWRSDFAPPAARKVAVRGVAAHTVLTATLSGLAPGQPFDYRLLKQGKPVFAARAQAPKPLGAPKFRFVAFGDCADGGAGQKRVAYRAHQEKPDFVLVTGDIVYDHGRASEYRDRFFPVYNAAEADPKRGAPLLRATPFVGVSGNHDLAYANLGRYPDGLAYYYYWAHPGNGPVLPERGPNVPPVKGADGAVRAFRAGAGTNFPRGANFSFDYGSAHFAVLDANYYADWTAPELRAWLEKDLEAAQGATWRFVALHVPPFHSSRKHQDEQWMRVLTDVFEKHKVDVVLSGHVHNYQRSKPLRFQAVRGLDGNFVGRGGRVQGEFAFDEAFDGATRTRPNGVIYLVTGAGGGGLYDRGQQDKPDTLQPFTAKYVADNYSLTVLDVDGPTLTVRQVDAAGKERDRFVVTK